MRTIHLALMSCLPLLACGLGRPSVSVPLTEDAPPETVRELTLAMGCHPERVGDGRCEHWIGLRDDLRPSPTPRTSSPVRVHARLGPYLPDGALGALAFVDQGQGYQLVALFERVESTWTPIAKWNTQVGDTCLHPERPDGLKLVACFERPYPNPAPSGVAIRGPLSDPLLLEVPGAATWPSNRFDFERHDDTSFTLDGVRYTLRIDDPGPRVLRDARSLPERFRFGPVDLHPPDDAASPLHEHGHDWVGALGFNAQTERVVGRLFPAKSPFSEDAEVVDTGGEEAPAPPPRHVVLEGDRWIDAPEADNTPSPSVPGCPLAGAPHPEPRAGYAAAFIPERGHCVFFGGTTPEPKSPPQADTWLWDGTRATKLPASSAQPEARRGGRLIWEPHAQRVVLAGGEAVSEGAKAELGTWVLQDQTWTRLPEGGPSPLRTDAVFYDPVAERTHLLRTAQPAGQPSRQPHLWSLEGDTWEEVALPSQPTPPNPDLSAAVYDPTRRRLVYTSGLMDIVPANPTTTSRNDTWVFEDQRWRELRPSRQLERSRHALAYDPTRDRFVLFGGRGGDYPYRSFDDTWEAERGGTWRRVHDGRAGPGVVRWPKMIAHPARGEVLLLDSANASLWAWDGTSWRKHEPAGSTPSPRTEPYLDLRSDTGDVYLFGGRPLDAEQEPLTDLWRWDGEAWHAVPSSDDSPAGKAHGFAWHPGDQRFYTILDHEIWTLDPDSGAWSAPGLAVPRDPHSFYAFAWFPAASTLVASPQLWHETDSEAPPFFVLHEGAWEAIPLSPGDHHCLMADPKSQHRADQPPGGSIHLGTANALDTGAGVWVFHGGTDHDVMPITTSAACALQLAEAAGAAEVADPRLR